MNPPYSKGNVITKNIIDSLDFDCLVNLMPIKCYKSNNLYTHIIPQSIIYSDNTTQFSDAFVTPIIATLSKNILTNTSNNFELFELCCVYDQRLQKYWHEQLNRNQTFLVHMYALHKKDFANISSKTSYSCGIYTPNIMLKNGPKTIKNTDGSFKLSDRHYIWNFLKPNNSIDNYFTPTTLANDDLVISQTVTVFATEQEADNFKAWAHSGELSGKGRLRGLFSILLRAMNKPTACPFRYVIPRVDWSRSWTDEEILADYGYTAEEIEEILHFNDDI